MPTFSDLTIPGVTTDAVDSLKGALLRAMPDSGSLEEWVSQRDAILDILVSLAAMVLFECHRQQAASEYNGAPAAQVARQDLAEDTSATSRPIHTIGAGLAFLAAILINPVWEQGSSALRHVTIQRLATESLLCQAVRAAMRSCSSSDYTPGMDGRAVEQDGAVVDEDSDNQLSEFFLEVTQRAQSADPRAGEFPSTFCCSVSCDGVG